MSPIHDTLFIICSSLHLKTLNPSCDRVFYYTSVLVAEINPNTSRMESKAAPEGKGSFPQHDEFGSGKSSMVDLYRLLEEMFDRSDKQLDELTVRIIATNQRLAQPQNLATEAGVISDMTTCKRTEGAEVDRAKHGDNSSARVNDDPTRLTSLDMIAEPISLASEICIGDALTKATVSTRGSAHAIIRRWWLNTRRHCLYNDEAHLSPNVFFLGPWSGYQGENR